MGAVAAADTAAEFSGSSAAPLRQSLVLRHLSESSQHCGFLTAPVWFDAFFVRLQVQNRDGSNPSTTSRAAVFAEEIAGAFGLNIVRIGQMGEQCRAPNLFRVLHALL